MKNLANILQAKADILLLANAFGFHSIKIHKNDKSKILELLVEEPSNNSYKNRSYFEVQLVQLLGCQVSIISFNTLSPLYKPSYQEESASLDETELTGLYKQPLETVAFVDANQDDNLYKILLNQSSDILLKKKGALASTSTLFDRVPPSAIKDIDSSTINIDETLGTATITLKLPDNLSADQKGEVNKTLEICSAQAQERLRSIFQINPYPVNR